MPVPDTTIAITVYDRREFILQAVASALRQTRPVKVMVVEDCGPDPEIERMVRREFGNTIAYHRNSHRRGLFDNWNACLEFCDTPWLSILHDDDYLSPDFVETMNWMRAEAADKGLYFGNFHIVLPEGTILPHTHPPSDQPVTPIDLELLAKHNVLGFPGHIFSVEAVRQLGGFRKGSWFSGDWEMWFNLTAHFGGVRTDRDVAAMRAIGTKKGSSRIVRMGLDHAATIIQRKRNFAYLRQLGRARNMTVREMRLLARPQLRVLLKHAATFRPRMLEYNLSLLRQYRAHGLREWVGKIISWLLPNAAFLMVSSVRKWCEAKRSTYRDDRSIRAG
jgi:glycosyltransferase involved in cell wall biosynthesis